MFDKRDFGRDCQKSEKITFFFLFLQLDLRGISQGILPDINKSAYENIPGNIVLQIQKIKNLSSPKSSEINSGIPSLLKLSLTDGVQTVQAIQMDNIQSIHLNTYPGSKIHITAKTVDISHSFLLLYNSNTQFLGGKVDSLVEKWEWKRVSLFQLLFDKFFFSCINM